MITSSEQGDKTYITSQLKRDAVSTYYQKNREKILKQIKVRKSTDKGKLYSLYMSLKYRAKQRNLEFDLELSDLVWPEFCPVLGIPIFHCEGKAIPNSPSVDRYDNTKGYTKENIRLISLRANLLKKDATLEEMRNLLRYMEGT